MRLEAIVSEAQREEICRAAESGIGSAAVVGWRQDRAFSWGVRKNLLDFVCSYQRDVRRDDECVVFAASRTYFRRHFDGAGFPGIRRIGDHFEIVLTREFNGKWVAGYQRARRMFFPCRDCGGYILQHGLRQLGACGLIEYGGEALLGGR